MGRGDEDDVVMAVGEEGNGEEEDGEETMEMEVARWKELLPRVPVRVLLVEGDDSTRQIIAALLRKCNYKVAAASDGLKAWDALKEKPRSIDLVLTEVELPSVSGFSLLNMIMDHEACKNIPVIMMSSQDSMSVIFKCMLKGAADFLVKPVRKNELRNLWQHVWRRQLANHGNNDNDGPQDEIDIKHNLSAKYGKNSFFKNITPAVQENNEYSEQNSDAQSSCTRSDMETLCAEKQSMVKLKLTKSREQNPEDDTLIQEGKDHIQLQGVPAAHQSKYEVTDEDLISARASTNNKIDGADHNQKHAQEKASKEVDLIHVMANQGRLNEVPLDKVTSTNVFSGINESSRHKQMSDAVPHLELSLRSCEESICKEPANEELNLLNHSNSSAFSRYSNKKVVPVSSKPVNLSTRRQEDQEEKAVQCTPVRVIPFSLPVGGIPLDGSCAPMMQPLFCQQPGHPLWSAFSPIWQEATQGNLTAQSKTGHIDSIQGNHLDDCNSKSVSNQSEEIRDEPGDLLNEQKHVVNIEVESASTTICSADRIQLDNSQCESIYQNSSWNIDPTSGYKPSTEHKPDIQMLSHEGKMQTDVHRLNLREAALNKFRLKRKERCFEKKVRYESRKLLAQQRPRVKGQFVRKMQVESTTPSGCSNRNLE